MSRVIVGTVATLAGVVVFIGAWGLVDGKRQAEKRAEKAQAALAAIRFTNASDASVVAAAFKTKGTSSEDPVSFFQHPELGQVAASDLYGLAAAATPEQIAKIDEALTADGWTKMIQRCHGIEGKDGTWSAGYCTYEKATGPKA